MLAAGWVKVRFCPMGETWCQATDGLLGTEVYGLKSSTTAGWSVDFLNEVPGYDMIVFMTGDGSKFVGFNCADASSANNAFKSFTKEKKFT